MNKHSLRLVTIAALAGALGAPGVLHAQSQPDLPAEHLRSLDASEASLVLGALRREQAKLKNGEKAYFELSSGAPASYDQNRIGPRDAFVDLNLDDVWLIERKSPKGEVFPRYEITVAPNGGNAPLWTIEVTMTWPRDVTRIIEVTMFYGPPAPF
ncbi:hypothetical protein [Alteriqipengyuania sp. 357]